MSWLNLKNAITPYKSFSKKKKLFNVVGQVSQQLLSLGKTSQLTPQETFRYFLFKNPKTFFAVKFVTSLSFKTIMSMIIIFNLSKSLKNFIFW